jgi:hypothetical protein
MITKKNKAVYRDITNLGLISRRTAFNVARVNSGDQFVRLQPLGKVPVLEAIDINRYIREYTVAIGDDILWIPDEELTKLRIQQRVARENYEREQREKEEAERQAKLADNVEGGEEIAQEDVQDLDTV